MFPLKDNIPTEKFPVVTVTLIVLNVLAYFLWQRGGLTLGDPSSQHYYDNLVRYSELPFEVTHPGQQCIPANSETFECAKSYGAQYNLPPTYLTVFTAMFMHGGLLHLGGNMLFLWIFGNNVEDYLSKIGFVVFYLFTGVVAGAVHVLSDPGSTTPVVGASGAIAGVMGMYLVLWPRARVLTIVPLVLFFAVYLPASVVLLAWFGLQFLTSPSSGVAWVAHVGGFLAGALVGALLRQIKPPRRLGVSSTG